MYYKVPKDMLMELPDDIRSKIEDECEYVEGGEDEGEDKPLMAEEEKGEGEMPGEKKNPFADMPGRKPAPDMGDKAKKKIKSFDDASDKGMALMVAVGKPKGRKVASQDEGY